MQAFAIAHTLGLRPPRFLTYTSRRPATCASISTPRLARATLSPDSNLNSATADPGHSVPSSNSTDSSITDSSLDSLPVSSDAFKQLTPGDQTRIISVRTQMEFWFSASNLRRDWYLRRQMDPEGWLDPSVFLLFNRVKSLNASVDDIILACSISDELEVSVPSPSSFGDTAGQTRVRRSTSLPDFREWDEEELKRSFMLKRIPADSTIESIQAIFQPLADVSYVRIYQSKDFPNSPKALICFEDVHTADSVFAAFGKDARPEAQGIVMRRRIVAPNSSPEESIAGKGTDLVKVPLLVFQITSLAEDVSWKTLFSELGFLLKHKADQQIRYLMYAPGSTQCYFTILDNVASRDIIDDLVTNGLEIDSRRASVRFLEDSEELRKYWVTANAHQAARKARRAEREAQYMDPSAPLMSRNPQGVIVKIESIGEDVTWQEVKSELCNFGRLVYLTYERKEEVCYARFGTPEEAQSVVAYYSGEDANYLCGGPVQACILEGEEEEKYWERAEEVQKARRSR